MTLGPENRQLWIKIFKIFHHLLANPLCDVTDVKKFSG